MTTVPIRNLGQYGVNTDTDPLLLPANAFTMGVNCRFDANGINRGPVFKTAGTLSLNTHPQYALGYFEGGNTGFPTFIIGNQDGTVTRWNTGTLGGASTETNISPSDWTPSVSTQPYTSTIINDVLYLNRPDRVPWYVAADASGTTMAELTPTNCGWDTTWRCAAIRSIAGVVVAINVTKGATSYPTMIKTSDLTTYGNLPDTWTGSASNSATENILADCPEALVDGCVLRDRMFLYTTNYTWIMEPTYDSFVFGYQRVFTNAGVINVNCVTEVDNTHYVFGNDDIWVHDGFQKRSIANKRVRKFIFDNLVKSQSGQCFVVHNQRQSEISFNYVSIDPFCAFPVNANIGTPGCNRSAVYNYRSDTWQFDDLPYVTFASPGVATGSIAWNRETTVSWSTLGGTWSSFAADIELSNLYVGPTVPIPGIVASVRTFERDNSVYSIGLVNGTDNAPVFLENSYIDLDQVSSEIKGYKVVSSIYPVARFEELGSSIQFAVGSADYAASPPPAYSTPMSYDGGLNYKLDYMTSGRFLSFQAKFTGTTGFLLSGMDLDFYVTGRR